MEKIVTLRDSLWGELCGLNSQVTDMPWLVTGDFNTARYSSEKVGGRPLSLSPSSKALMIALLLVVSQI